MRALLFTLLFAASPLVAQAETTVFVVRHAEKAKDGGKDPDLTAEGRRRAATLADALRSEPIAAVYTTTYKRNKQTAAPTAERFGLKMTVLDADATDELAKAVKSGHDKKAVLVVGHSNTVPEILTKLGVKHDIELSEKDYDNLFVVRLDGGKAELVRLHFGAMTHSGSGKRKTR